MIFFPFDFSLSSEILRARLNKQIYTNAGSKCRVHHEVPRLHSVYAKSQIKPKKQKLLLR